MGRVPRPRPVTIPSPAHREKYAGRSGRCGEQGDMRGKGVILIMCDEVI